MAPIWGFRFFHICLVDSAGQQISVAFMLRGISQPVIPIETLCLFLGGTFLGSTRIQHPQKQQIVESTAWSHGMLMYFVVIKKLICM